MPIGCDKCDQCGEESAIYERFPTCRNCGDVICYDCAAVTEADEGRIWGYCHECHQALQEELEAEETVDVDFSA